MKYLTNLVLNDDMLSELPDSTVFCDFLERIGCDGVEVIRCGGDTKGIVPPEKIVGVHLLFFSDWVDFWNGDTARLKEKFGDRAAWEAYYGCGDREGLVRQFQSDLDYAQSVGAEYVVFHVSDVSIEECYDYHWRHTNRQVVQASLELLNQLLEGKEYCFEVLLENLWWPGLTLTEPEITQELLDGLHYTPKGLVMDTGHLMHTCTALRTQEEAVAYLQRVLEDHPALAEQIHGVHLHQTVSGAYVQRALEHITYPVGGFFERFATAYTHIQQIDAHRPVTVPEIAGLIERIHPNYLVNELCWNGWKRREEDVKLQMQVLKKTAGEKNLSTE